MGIAVINEALTLAPPFTKWYATAAHDSGSHHCDGRITHRVETGSAAALAEVHAGSFNESMALVMVRITA